MNPFDQPMEQLIRRPLSCTCGKTHRTELKKIVIEPDALCCLPEVLQKFSAKKMLLVADSNTKIAAADRALAILGERGFSASLFVFETPPKPDGDDVGQLLLAIPPDTALLIACGSGSLHDAVKYVAKLRSLPLVSLPTAASTAAYTLPTALLKSGDEVTKHAAQLPFAVIADLRVIADAPKHLSSYGAAAVLSTTVALFDWKLSELVEQTPYCADLADGTRRRIDRFVDSLSGSRPLYTADTQKLLMEALLFQGLTASYFGSDDLLFGSETLMARQMQLQRSLDRAEALPFEVLRAVSASNLTRMLDGIIEQRPDFQMASHLLEGYGWLTNHREITRVYGEHAPSILSAADGAGRYNKKTHARRLRMLSEHWDEITENAEQTVSPYAVFREQLRVCTLPYRFEDIGCGRQAALDALLWSKELSNRFCLLELVWAIGELDSAAGSLTASMRG